MFWSQAEGQEGHDVLLLTVGSKYSAQKCAVCAWGGIQLHLRYSIIYDDILQDVDKSYSLYMRSKSYEVSMRHDLRFHIERQGKAFAS
jgi:hypothetical protein